MKADIDQWLVDEGRLDGLLCFSHLRWSFVWQRPQHILTRLAATTDIVVVEEPEPSPYGMAASLRVRSTDGLTVLTPLLASLRAGPGFNPATNAVIARLLSDYLRTAGWTTPGRRNGVWYYTPMAVGAFPVSVQVDVTIYDVMDELANFSGAATDLRQREQTLLDQADLVFTGGPSLFNSRKDRHPAIYCFPSGVEARHFQAARSIVDVPDDIASLPRPILGFYGVIDERLDSELLAGVADRRPEWTLVLIGPVVKIDPAGLPVRANIQYLGMRTYDELPAYLASFDVAILPFAINEATRFISPTKTLEYLAGGRPVVSTPIVDVAELYGDVVEIADGPDAFVGAVERLLSASDADRTARDRRAGRMLGAHEWDAIVEQMASAITSALTDRHRSAVDRALVGAPAD